MKITLPARERQQMLKLSVAVVVLVPSYFMLLSPLRSYAVNVRQQAKDAKVKAQMLEATTASEASLRSQTEQLEQTVGALRSALPAEGELSATIKLLSDLAQQSQVKVQTIFPMPDREPISATATTDATPNTPVVFKEALIQIDALAGYHQLGMFLSLIESQPQPMRVSSLRISSDAKELKRHRIKLVIRSFMAAASAEDDT